MFVGIHMQCKMVLWNDMLTWLLTRSLLCVIPNNHQLNIIVVMEWQEEEFETQMESFGEERKEKGRDYSCNYTTTKP